MIDIIFKTVITFLAIYGLYNLISDLLYHLSRRFDNHYTNDYVIVVKVRNSEESIEGVIRGIIMDFLKLTSANVLPDILIVDMGSTDQTGKIAKKLSRDYAFVHYTTKELYDKAKEDMVQK